MFLITDIDDKEHVYVCEDSSDVFDVILRITKSEKDAKNAMTIAKMMDWYDNYICFNKYTIECRYRIEEKYKRILSQDELETMLNNAFENGRKESIDNVWSELQDRTKKEKQSNPPEFLTKCMNIPVPDCNECGYLNFTEKEQQLYGLNSYKKDHRCKCYERPVYHRENSRDHDPYIHPCYECLKDNFVNYYDCESSKCNKKGE